MIAAPLSPIRRVRCAIYTRKSSDEGLEQSFNSLDAQHDACAAYVLSQASEGWSTLPERFDDGGISGGTLERPGLKRLLADIAAGRVDVVVVYKVDRLTRSLLDFAKLVEAFDKAGVEFVSITQSFNTTSSMGRLTLNMLLSFAQFEREVTAERIRDKIAASKARGMWMGGVPPIGYKPDGRSLAIVEEHAALVRCVFETYLEVGTVRRLAQCLAAGGRHAPERTTATGRTIGKRPLSEGQLRVMLKNRIFLGEIAHRGKVYPGLHPPILARTLWESVQARMAANVQGERTKRVMRRELLAGKLVDQAGEPLIATHACKAGRGGPVRYRYYVSKALHLGQSAQGLRIPAREIEALVGERLARTFDDALALAAMAWLDLPADRLAELAWRASALAVSIRRGDREVFALLATEVQIGEREVKIRCSTDAVATSLGVAVAPNAPETFTLLVDARVRRSGRAMRLISDDGAAAVCAPDPSLVRALTQARRWWAELRLGRTNVTALAQQQGRSASYITRIVRLAFLSPEIVAALLSGRQSAQVDVTFITLRHELAADWREQAQALLGAKV